MTQFVGRAAVPHVAAHFLVKLRFLPLQGEESQLDDEKMSRNIRHRGPHHESVGNLWRINCQAVSESVANQSRNSLRQIGSWRGPLCPRARAQSGKHTRVSGRVGERRSRAFAHRLVVLAEIETEKSTVEMEALASGTLVEQTLAPGQEVPVGTVIGYLDDGQ